MKHLLLFTAIFCVALLSITSCEMEKTSSIQTEEPTQAKFIKQHVALVDARIRSISQTYYVREAVFINFSNESNMPTMMIYDGTTLFDNGSYNDLNSGDGIYTSAAKFKHNENIPFSPNIAIKSVMDRVIIDKEFEHDNELIKAVKKYSSTIKSKSMMQGISITCDIEWGTGGCKADAWGWCNSCCFTYSNCSATISIPW